MKKGKIFWGVSLIVVALVLIINSIGQGLGLIAGIPVSSIILGALCVAWIITLIVKKHFCIVYFPLAFIFMLFEEQIAKLLGSTQTNIISNWLLLLYALMLCIGTAFLMSYGKHTRFREKYNISGHIPKNSFNSTIRYIDCTDFTNETVEVNMGSCEVFFENTENYAGNGTLCVESNMASLVIHVPSDWRIINNVENNLGSTTIPSGNAQGKTITICGECNMGSLNVVTE
ncbi:MAG TPA: hypothetical protein PLT66_05105 [Bacillota bacterium]|nr:hypothetical protein [Bacillota bacterium]